MKPRNTQGGFVASGRILRLPPGQETNVFPDQGLYASAGGPFESRGGELQLREERVRGGGGGRRFLKCGMAVVYFLNVFGTYPL